MSKGILAGFLHNAVNTPNAPALLVDDQTYSYQELNVKSLALASEIQQHKSKAVAIQAERSLDAYVAILATLRSGKAYVPLNSKYPDERCKTMIEASNCSLVIVGESQKERAEELAKITNEVVYIKALDESREQGETLEVARDDFAYILFTSGSTGVPKGVPITHRNASAYVEYIVSKYKINRYDRVSQAFDLTFDPSVHDIFTTWTAGACLCVLSDGDLRAPSKFIREKKLTVWYSVPSVARYMKGLRMLKPEVFPLLRFTFFSGEALTQDVTEIWQQAAPNARIVNYYGPTEVTINVTEYEWNKDKSPGECANGMVPLGTFFPHVPVTYKSKELYLGGIQVSPGYTNASDKNDFHFVKEGSQNYFRTGDLIKEDGGLVYFMGRVDDQIKIRGFRVELGEVDLRLKEATQATEVVTVAHCDDQGNIVRLVGFVTGSEVDTEFAMDYMNRYLPDYMVPQIIVSLDQMPLNINQKIDLNQLRLMAATA